MPELRLGKTRRDKKRGVWGNRFANREQRLAWQRSGAGNGKFPRFSCNGKKNRSCVTAKNGVQIDPATKEKIS